VESIGHDGDSICGDLGRILAVAGVICADHEDDGFRGDAIDFPVAETPEDILGFVGVVAEVENGFSEKSLGDDLGGLWAFEGLGDRIAEEYEINRSALLSNLAEFCGVARLSALAFLRNGCQGRRQRVGRGGSLPEWNSHNPGACCQEKR
jgi:hypothetical protein